MLQKLANWWIGQIAGPDEVRLPIAAVPARPSVLELGKTPVRYNGVETTVTRGFGDTGKVELATGLMVSMRDPSLRLPANVTWPTAAALDAPSWSGEWSRARANEVEAALGRLVAALPSVSGVHGTSRGPKDPDYKICFDSTGCRTTCYLQYDPARRSLQVWTGGLYDGIPADLRAHLDRLFPDAYRFERSWAGSDGLHHWQRVAQGDIERP